MPFAVLLSAMHVLVAVDGSPESADALAHALTVAGGADDRVTIVHAVDPSVYEIGGSEPISDIADASDRILLESVSDAEERGQDVLEEAAETAERVGVEAETELLYGPPVERIVSYAERAAVDLVVVGHQGMSDRLEGVLGSVAKTVAERSSVPVTIVH